MHDSVQVISLWNTDKYSVSFPSISLMHEEDCFVECLKYDAIIAVASGKNKELNIFEETVLKFLGNTGWSLEEISERSCMDKDFVKAITDSLRHKKYIEANNVLTESGKAYLNVVNDEIVEKNNVEEQTVNVFMLKESKQLLPIVIMNDNKYSSYGIIENKIMEVKIGSSSKGKESRVRGRCIFSNLQGNELRYIYPYEIKQIIKVHNKRNINKINIDNSYAINVSKSGVKCFLHVKCGVQQGMVDQLAVSDGTEMMNGMLVQHLFDYHSQYIDFLQKRATTIHSRFAEDKNESKYDKYYDIRQSLDKMEPFLDDASFDAQAINAQRRQGNIIKLYSAVEHIFHHYVKRNPLSMEQENSLRTSDVSARKYLERCAERIGLYIPKYRNIFGAYNQSVYKLYKKSDVPNAYAVVPLAVVASALGNNPNDGLRRASRQNKNLLQDIQRLSMSKTLRHGSEEEKDLFKDYDYLKEVVVNLVIALIPDYYKLQTNSMYIADNNVYNISQEKLNAIVELKNIIGHSLYYAVGENLRNDMVRLSPYYKGINMLSPMEFVNCLYRCLENYVRGKLECLEHNSNSMEQAIDYVERNLDIVLPNSIRKSSKEMYDRAKRGKGAALASYALILFSRLPVEKLKKYNSKVYIDVIDEILRLRVHGNNTELNVTKTDDELAELRIKVFELMKGMEQ